MTDDDITVEEFAAYDLPYKRKISLRTLDYQNGLQMLRLVLREGTRITQVDIDTDMAATLAGEFQTWAEKHGHKPEN